MIRIEISQAYDLALALAGFRHLFYDASPADLMPPTIDAHTKLANFIETGFAADLNGAVTSGRALLAQFDRIKENEERPGPLGEEIGEAVQEALRNFETVLKSAVDLAAIYFVNDKRGWRADMLISSGAQVGPTDLRAKCPQAADELDMAMRCLAFELSTGAGFHLHRAHEVVVVAFGHAIGATMPTGKSRSLGNYIKAIANKGGDAQIVQNLTFIKDSSRNTLMHPEDSLTMEQAVELLWLILRSMSTMLPAIDTPAE
ncbi:MAG: hypothetical protein ABIV36_21650 [Sphingobium limneticum]